MSEKESEKIIDTGLLSEAAILDACSAVLRLRAIMGDGTTSDVAHALKALVDCAERLDAGVRSTAILVTAMQSADAGDLDKAEALLAEAGQVARGITVPEKDGNSDG